MMLLASISGKGMKWHLGCQKRNYTLDQLCMACGPHAALSKVLCGPVEGFGDSILKDNLSLF